MVGGEHDMNNGVGKHHIRRIVHRLLLASSCVLFILFAAIAIVGWTVDAYEYRFEGCDHKVTLAVNPGRPYSGGPALYMFPPLPLCLSIEHGRLAAAVFWQAQPTASHWAIASGRGLGYEYRYGTYLPDVHSVYVSMSLLYPWMMSSICPAVVGVRHIRKRRRMRRSSVHCGACDYNLSGNVSGVCPECGSAIPEVAMARITNEEPAT